VDIICAGDVFHKWNSPPELINWAIEHLPRMYAIPGQHDLPYHRYEDIKRSAYWTLVEAGRIENLPPCMGINVGKDLLVYGFPWGANLVKIPDSFKKELPGQKPKIHLAVVHAYCWSFGHSFPGVEEDKHANEWYKRLRSYDVAVFGDNHKGFLEKYPTGGKGHFYLWNNGGLYRAKSDEAHYQPHVGILYSDSSVRPYAIDVSKDNWDLDMMKTKGKVDVEELIEMLDESSEKTFDFKEAIRRAINRTKVSDSVRKILLQSIED
jgi:hypothetical protein